MDQERPVLQGLFIVYEDLSANSGVNKKIRSQIAAFRQAGIAMEPWTMPSATGAFLYKLRYRLPFSNLSPRWQYSEIFDHVDLVYLRRPFFLNVWALSFFRKLKRRNPGVRVVYELPTYPYDLEITEKKRNLPVYWKDVICRQFLRRYVDRISNLGPEQEVFGIPVIRIRNGYDFGTIRPKRPKTEQGDIGIAVVARFDSWHGYDRLMRGLQAYYQNGGARKFTLHLAGDGPALPAYEQLSKDLGIEDSCVFYGMLDREQLQSVYDRCDFGASSFGLYRKGLSLSCDLKSREYLAAGLPILFGGHMDLEQYEDLHPFLVQFSNDDTNVDFFEIERCYDRIYGQGQAIENVVGRIRAIAQRELTMEKAMEPVIQYIKNEAAPSGKN